MGQGRRTLWPAFGIFETHSGCMLHQSLVVEACGETVRWVLGAFNLGEPEISTGKTILDPQVRNRQMADAA